MPRRALKFLFDIRESCDLLMRFTAGKTIEDYCSDPMLRSAVERQFEIIGESRSQALRLEPSLAHEMTDTGRIIAFRNQLIHGYPNVVHETVWGILQGKLPTLRMEVDRLLADSA
jgi:uncharacterized protein with HEPN domain